MHEPRSRIFGASLVVGLVFVLIGVLLILDNFGYISASHVLQFWPALVIAIGLGKVLNSASFGSRLVGAFWVLAGGVFLASTLMLIPINIWPLLLIFVGILVIGHAGWGSARRQRSVKAAQISVRTEVDHSVQSQDGDDNHPRTI